jgi:ATPase subunit of ABC transporter with duplicated ATPase domains
MKKKDSIIKFNQVSFGYDEERTILRNVNFFVNRKSKTTIMGQNGAGKTTIFKLIVGDIIPEEGKVNIASGASVALSRQIIPENEMKLTVRQFFEKALNSGSKKKVYDVDPRIDKVLDIVNLFAPKDRIIRSFSGGQKAKLLLASALIKDADILLLDEPTNNLDKEALDRLTDFLKTFSKTLIVISHDAEFLNSFTEGVLYLDVFSGEVEQFKGTYFNVREQIASRQQNIERKNSILNKQIASKYAKAGTFINKGGKMRLVAKRMRQKAQELDKQKVELRMEDKTIHSFNIPCQSNIRGEIVNISSVTIIKDGSVYNKRVNIDLRKNEHLLIKGPNGIGKTSLLNSIAQNESKYSTITEGINIGYYRQDFSGLKLHNTVYEFLSSIPTHISEVDMRSIAARFLLTEDIMHSKIKDISEGQKGLLTFACLVIQQPGLLIVDEPTNHINFRHIPVIAEALNNYLGAMILVSHSDEFLKEIRIDKVINMETGL